MLEKGTLLAEFDQLAEAVAKADDFNRDAREQGARRFAVVVDRSAATARQCTPLTYRIASIKRPKGWEPTGPFDLPERATELVDLASLGAAEPFAPLDYTQALTVLGGLNRQSRDRQTQQWYVVVAREMAPAVESVGITRRVWYLLCPEKQDTIGRSGHAPMEPLA